MDLDDLEGPLRGRGAWVTMGSFGYEQEDLLLENGHEKHRCACGTVWSLRLNWLFLLGR